MGLFNRLFKKKEYALNCKLQDVYDLLSESVSIGAPITNLIVRIDNQVHKIGVSADMTKAGKYFDIIYYYDDIEQQSLGALMALIPFSWNKEITVIEDEEMGDPHYFTLLANREIKK